MVNDGEGDVLNLGALLPGSLGPEPGVFRAQFLDLSVCYTAKAKDGRLIQK